MAKSNYHFKVNTVIKRAWLIIKRFLVFIIHIKKIIGTINTLMNKSIKEFVFIENVLIITNPTMM